MRDFYSTQVYGKYFPLSHGRAVPERYNYVLDAIETLIGSRVARPLLEIGPEQAGVSDIVSKRLRLGTTEYVAVEASKPSANHLVHAGYQVILTDVSEAPLPFRPNTFGAVIASEVLEHLVNPDNFVREIHRVIRTDGIFVLTTPNLASWYNRLALLAGLQPVMTETGTEWNVGWGSLRPRTRPVGHLRLFTLKSLLEFLELHHFELAMVNGMGIEGGLGSSSLISMLDRTISKVPSLSSCMLVACRVSQHQD